MTCWALGLFPERLESVVFAIWPILVVLGLGFFLIGTVVGSFLNVCIYRIPWQRSVIWPSSRCPSCLNAIAGRDNIPVVSWLALRGECRHCGASISVRYPLVEVLVGCLFLGAYLIDVIVPPRAPWQFPAARLLAASYHCVFLSLLVAATFIDYDYWEIPKQITDTGILLGILLGTIWPHVRPSPASWPGISGWGGSMVGVWGCAVAWGLTQVVRKSASFVFGREAMGFGDVTLMGMIGAFLGWQAAVLTFFLGPFFAIGHAAWKLLKYLKKRLTGAQLSSSDRELPYGPYLSMAAATLFYLWPRIWDRWAKELFQTFYVIFWWLLGINV
jgi:leader peptidase (prepilin peptidase)/N-methyltransferase